MKFIADLHIHSKYSRATSRNLDLENLYTAARLKGITVIGTGDFTHPAWFAELKEKLIPAEEGLFRLKPDIEKECDRTIPGSCGGDVRFMLESEISNIYKKGDRTRKNHNLVFFPDFDSAEQFNIKLDAIGNIKSDGRPILGLDTRDLLEILLETDHRGFLIPAHIWTPWFSLFGSKSGFDSIEECFEDLSPEIFAVETGLSSDPPMNWRVSALDGLTLVSNSDAHSPSKLGREANLFNTTLSYPDIKHALKTGDKDSFLGTMEFFPEEGKYHNDGHRKCNISLSADESVELKGICPECGKPMTLGVNYRVLELADRKPGEKPEKHHPFYSIIPLDEIIAEITGTGPKSKRVQRTLATAIGKLGPEFDILRNHTIDEIKTAGIPLLGEAVERMRNNSLHIVPGFDGEFGKIKLFTEDEKQELSGQKLLFTMPAADIEKSGYIRAGSKKAHGNIRQKHTAAPRDVHGPTNSNRMEAPLNPLQERAVLHENGPLIIVAGPGTGKTHTITKRIAHLIGEKQVDPQSILAITFTNKAAGEMKERLSELTGLTGKPPFTATFHSLCYTILKDFHGESSVHALVDDKGRKTLIETAANAISCNSHGLNPIKILSMIETAKQLLLSPDDDLSHIADKNTCSESLLKELYHAYMKLLDHEGLYDFEDLIFRSVKLLKTHPDVLMKWKNAFSHIFVDEYQDLNYGQYTLIRTLTTETSNICVIGDPDQAIYGFRGSDAAFFNRFIEDYPGARQISLNQNYRSAETILKASTQVIQPNHKNGSSTVPDIWSGIDGIKTVTLLENNTDVSEAVAIGKLIEKMIGGTGFHSVDFGTADRNTKRDFGFSDFAVLFRTGAQGETFAEAFEKGGIPCQLASRKSIYDIDAISALLSCLRLMNSTGSSRMDIERIQKVSSDTESGVNEAITHCKKSVSGLSIQEQIVYLQQTMDGIRREITNSKKAEEAFYHILKMSEPFGENIHDFLKTCALESDHDVYDFKSEKVTLMTMHAAKGLEFPVVFIAGCEDGNIPFKKPGDTGTDIEEERRLFYVAMTRARENLFVSYAKKRMVYGKTQERNRSPFINNVERSLLRHEAPAFANIEKQNRHVQLSLF